jgi:hypothetical protein
MPLQKLQFTPGVQHDGSRYSSSGSWSDADKVRFRGGAPEKIGGWQQAALEQQLEEMAEEHGGEGGLPACGVHDRPLGWWPL